MVAGMACKSMPMTLDRILPGNHDTRQARQRPAIGAAIERVVSGGEGLQHRRRTTLLGLGIESLSSTDPSQEVCEGVEVNLDIEGLQTALPRSHSSTCTSHNGGSGMSRQVPAIACASGRHQ